MATCCLGTFLFELRLCTDPCAQVIAVLLSFGIGQLPRAVMPWQTARLQARTVDVRDGASMDSAPILVLELRPEEGIWRAATGTVPLGLWRNLCLVLTFLVGRAPATHDYGGFRTICTVDRGVDGQGLKESGG